MRAKDGRVSGSLAESSPRAASSEHRSPLSCSFLTAFFASMHIESLGSPSAAVSLCLRANSARKTVISGHK